jgi:hypothetical protein
LVVAVLTHGLPRPWGAMDIIADIDVALRAECTEKV